MSLTRKLMMAGNLDQDPLATDLDGTNDYLSRSSDFTGNSDGQTFTLSTWFYLADNTVTMDMFELPANNFYLFVQSGTGDFELIGKNTSNSEVLRLVIPYSSYALNAVDTFRHLLISLDLSNASNRKVYLDDIDITSGVTWSTYSGTIDFTDPTHFVGGPNEWKGRLADIYLDYTYRDLSIEANRRLFTTISPTEGLVTVGGSVLSGYNPIMTAFTDPDDLTLNEGTGGAWDVNGTMVRSQRGVNQWNAVASELDGGSDYLSGTLTTSDSKTITCSFYIQYDSTATATASYVFYTHSGGQVRLGAFITKSNGNLTIESRNSSNTNVVTIQASGIVWNGVSNHITFSFDSSSSLSRHLIVNGVEVSPSWPAYNDDNVNLSSLPCLIGRDNTSSFDYKGSTGEFYLDTSYIDLSVSNPFWDSRAGKPKYLGENGELPTGSTPLVYLPIRAGDEGNNLGSSGDFTVNSGPFVGARGMSEYWARGAYFNGTNAYLSRGSIGSSSKTFSIVSFFATTSSGGNTIFNGEKSGVDDIFFIEPDLSPLFVARNSSDTEIMQLRTTPANVSNFDSSGTTFNAMFLCVDMDSSGNCHYVFNGTSYTIDFATFVTGQSIAFDEITTMNIHRTASSGALMDGISSVLYLTTDYIDFSDEDNRLLFVDALGYPVPLQQSIDDGLIPDPLVYMEFTDTDDFGANSGTGGDFTVNGTVAQGADVNV